MKDKNSFILYKSFYPPISFLTLEQKGKLLDAIFHYQIDGSVDVDDDIKMPFLFFVNQFKVDEEKYNEICLKRSVSGKKGRESRCKQMQANASKCKQSKEEKQMQANVSLNDNDNVNENDNVDNSTVSFDTFWTLYDKKVDRSACEKKWNKLSERDRKAAIDYIPKYKEAQPNKQYRKNPETYLNRRAWENEIIFREEDSSINAGKIQKEGFEWKQ